MRLREVNYLTQSHTASTWQQHRLEPRLCGSDAGVPNTFTLLPLFLLMKQCSYNRFLGKNNCTFLKWSSQPGVLSTLNVKGGGFVNVKLS